MNKVKLSNYLEDSTVGFVGSMSKLFTEDGVPLLRGQNILPFALDLTDTKFISLETHSKWKKSALAAGDVVLVRVGLPGTCCVIPDGMGNLNAASLVILRTNKEKLDPYFLSIFFNSPEGKRQVYAYTVGSVQSVFNVKTANSIEIPEFNISEQKTIVALIKGINDKIETNQTMNQTLEKIANSIFKSWFVDFDPVRAKVKGRNTGLPTEISDLFPNELADTKIGKIPRGWEIKSAQDLFDISIGRTPPRKESHWFTESEKDVPWVSIRDMGDCGTFISKTRESLTHEAVNKHRMHILPIGSVLVSFKLTVGRVSIAAKEVTTNEAIAHFPPSGDFPNPNFVYFYLKGFRYDELGSTSSIATAVNSKMIKAIPFLIAPSELITKFEQIVAPMMKKIRLTSDEILLLSDLRDTLLPKLISGELRVPDAEKFLEEADI